MRAISRILLCALLLCLAACSDDDKDDPVDPQPEVNPDPEPTMEPDPNPQPDPNPEPPVDECAMVCSTVAMCQELIDACGAEVAVILEEGCKEACENPELEAQILAAGNLPCATVVPIAIDAFGVTEQCGGNELDCGELPYDSPEGDTATITSRSVDFLTMAPLAGVHYKACLIGDQTCQQPVEEADTDDDGRASMTFPTDGEGVDLFVEATGEGIQDALLFFGSPNTNDAEDVTQLLLSQQSTDALAASAGVEIDPERGHVGLIVQNCDGLAFSGAEIRISNGDEETKIVYLAGGTTDPDATSTDGTGAVAIYNVPPAGQFITAIDTASGGTIAAGSVFTRPGFLSQLIVRQSPIPPVDLSCVGSVEHSTPTTDTIREVRHLTDFITGERLAGVSVKACAASDDTCADPLAEDTTDLLGAFDLNLPVAQGEGGFDGYLLFEGDELFSSLFYFSSPLVFDHPSSTGLTALTKSTADILAGLVETDYDETRGHVAIQTNDCRASASAGLAIAVDSADGSSLRAYVTEAGLDTEAATTGPAGQGGFFNVPAGRTTVRSTMANDAEASSLDVIVRAGFFTQVGLDPTP